MTPHKQVQPVALAIEWVAKITTVALEMVLPGVAGVWLDQRWGTQFLGLLGFALGLVIGVWHLLLMLPKAKDRKSHPSRRSSVDDDQRADQPPDGI